MECLQLIGFYVGLLSAFEEVLVDKGVGWLVVELPSNCNVMISGDGEN